MIPAGGINVSRHRWVCVSLTSGIETCPHCGTVRRWKRKTKTVSTCEYRVGGAWTSSRPTCPPEKP